MEDIIIDVNDVTMTFRMTDTNIMSFKELMLSIAQRKVKVNEFSPLKHVSFQVEKGDVFGVIGRNGAGKSTLLKLISGILKPTEGNITVKGNVVPMLELGAGFDMDLTGRENVFLNGSILGYSKNFLDEKYDEIVEFSELGDFINMPIRIYSSGMLMRLAFSIASIVKPDILIADEILAVGDERFQEKSRARMLELMQGGSTVLFVSHDLSQIRQMCNKVIWLENHEVKMIGKCNEVCDKYDI